MRYTGKPFAAEATVETSTANRPAPEFGETRKPGYMFGDIAVSRSFVPGEQRISVNLGINNILDQYYTTFADWFGIPSMGRNVYGHVVYAW